MAFNILSLIFLAIAITSVIHKLLFKIHVKEITGVVTGIMNFNGKEYKRRSAFRMYVGSPAKLLVDCNNPRKTSCVIHLPYGI